MLDIHLVLHFIMLFGNVTSPAFGKLLFHLSVDVTDLQLPSGTALTDEYPPPPSQIQMLLSCT